MSIRRSPIRGVVAAALVATAGIAAFTQMGGIAHAAVVDGAVLDITVEPTNVVPNALVRTNIDWCVPDGTNEGDTFTITMPEQLGDFPPSFDLLDPAGRLVAVATISGDPVTAVITMTDYVETRSSVCGEAWFESRMSDEGTENTTQTLTYVVNGGLTFERDVNVGGSVVPSRDGSSKRGQFADPADQCRTSTTDCIDWIIASRSGPFDQVEFTDLAADGLTFNCDRVLVTYWTLNPDGSRNEDFLPGQVGATATVDCSATSLSVVTGPLPAGMIVRVRVPSTPDEPGGPDGANYVNTATVGQTVGGDVEIDEVSAERNTALAGGVASGVAIDIEKYDTDDNDADTADDAVLVADGTAELVFTITNTGDELIDIEVTDVVTTGAVTVTGLSCDFSMAVDGAPTSGTTWAGPFPAGAQFDCAAQLSGVEVGDPHANTATVTGVSSLTGEEVSDDDPYHATRTPVTTTTVVATTTTAPPSPTTTTTIPPQQGAVTTSTTSTTVNPIDVTIPPTGLGSTSSVWIGLLALGLGAITLVLARKRNAPLI